MFLTPSTSSGDYHVYGHRRHAVFDKDYEYDQPQLQQPRRHLPAPYSLNRMMANNLMYHLANKRAELEDLMLDDLVPLDAKATTARFEASKSTAAEAHPVQSNANVSTARAISPKTTTTTTTAATDGPALDLSSTGLHEYDVVCGRSRMAHSHHGNKQFRRLIKEYSAAYQGAKAREEKKRITMTIIGAIHRLGGRFLKFEDGDDEIIGMNSAKHDKDAAAAAAAAGTATPITTFPATLCTEASAEYQYEKVSHALRSSSKSPRQARRRSSMSSTTSSSTDTNPADGMGMNTSASVVSLSDEQRFAQHHPATTSSHYMGYDDDSQAHLRTPPHCPPALVSPIREQYELRLTDDYLDFAEMEPIVDDEELNFQHVDLSLLFRL